MKAITGILACDESALSAARARLESTMGGIDLVSNIWPFDQTSYYADQIGPRILRQFVSFAQLVDPGELADLKHRTNAIEQELARSLGLPFPRPVNLDPGLIEPSKLVLATTKNYSHRIYIGRQMYAEVTLTYDRGGWRPLPHTYPDYRSQPYFDFFAKVRARLLEQSRATAREQ
ncbi:MAG: DUF4416 family protein [Sedimentisphaerales bacterium]|nr:DUF4416 family protein [Sedimentisphaerales bacterium]